MNSETHEGLAARIRRCAELAGSGDALAQKAAIPRRTLETYLSGAAEPKASRAAAIAAAAGVSLDWLVLGLGPEPNHTRDHPAGYHAEAAPQAPAAGKGAYEGWIDPEMLKVIVRVIAEYERDYGVIIDPHAKAELTALLCQVAGRLDDRSETSVARAVVDILKRVA